MNLNLNLNSNSLPPRSTKSSKTYQKQKTSPTSTAHPQPHSPHGYKGVAGAPTTRVPQAPSCPPRGWSGARVGVGILRGTIIFQDLKDSKNDLPKTPRFHAHPTIFKNIQYFPRTYFRFNRMSLCFIDFRIS